MIIDTKHITAIHNDDEHHLVLGSIGRLFDTKEDHEEMHRLQKISEEYSANRVPLLPPVKRPNFIPLSAGLSAGSGCGPEKK